MLFGCSESLTRAQLAEYCQGDYWHNNMLFDNLFNLEAIGRYGNANAAYLSVRSDIFVYVRNAHLYILYVALLGTCRTGST